MKVRDEDEGDKDNSDDDSILLLLSLYSQEDNTFENRKFYRTH